MQRKQQLKKKDNRKRKIRFLRPEQLLLITFCLSALFYFYSKTGLNSYNITLSVEEQNLASEVNEIQDEVQGLKTDISTLQDKTRMLGLVDDDMKENQDNVHVITE